MKLDLPKKENWPSFECYEYFHWFPPVRWVYMQRLKMAVSFLPEKIKNVLDAGFGDGVLLKSLSKCAQKVYGVDIHGANKMVYQMCEKEGILNKVKLFEAGVEKLPFEDSFFDAIVAVSVLEHVKDFDKTAKEFYRVLKPNGKLIVGLPIEGFFTKLMWKLFLRASFDHHKVSEKHVIAALEEKFSLIDEKYFFTKRFGLGLYKVCLFQKLI